MSIGPDLTVKQNGTYDALFLITLKVLNCLVLFPLNEPSKDKFIHSFI